MSHVLNGIRGALLGDAPTNSGYSERILIGAKNLHANLGPPCIVLIAEGGQSFTGPEGSGQDPQVPVIASKSITFSAHCWGAADPDDYTDVYTQAEYLADAVFTALRALVGAGNARIENETWPETGHDAAGVVLVRTFRADGAGVQQIQLPLDRPITLDAATMVTAVGPTGQTAPYDDSGVPATDGSIGVAPYVP
jgi:hypothetical protein